MNYKDYYNVLGVAKTAAEKDIKSAYRKLAKKWHPDANAGNAKAAEERFKEISEAYEVLGDTEKRRKYDALGSDWANAAQQAETQRQYRRQQSQTRANDPYAGFGGAAPGGGGAGFSDFFDLFFSGVGRGGGGRQTPNTQPAAAGEDLETPLDVTLADAFAGVKRSVSLQIDDKCPTCHGSGVVRGGTICSTCHGTGHAIVAKRFEVTIPKGVRDGQRIRLAGQGSSGTGGGSSGDLYLVVRFQADKTFERRGDDLYVDAPVSIYELVLGGEIRVPTMTGAVTLTVPPGTQSNKLLRLGGKGMPKVKGGGAGDQYVRLIGQLPTDLSARERELFTELSTMRA